MTIYARDHFGAPPGHGASYHVWRNVDLNDAAALDDSGVGIFGNQIPITPGFSVYMICNIIPTAVLGAGRIGILWSFRDVVAGEEWAVNADAGATRVLATNVVPVTVVPDDPHQYYNYIQPFIAVPVASRIADIAFGVMPIGSSMNSGNPFF